jgi:hypothetical protein
MAAPSNICFYEGTVADFSADSASATSALGNYYPASSGYATLYAAVQAGVVPSSCVPTAFRQNVQTANGSTVNGNNLKLSTTQAGYLWTLYANGVI